jgi:4-carboxymuconolactone decarboxylase
MPAGAVEAQRQKSVAPPAMQAIAPALADYTDKVLFGDVWKRPGLNPRDRGLITVTVLIATGKTAQLEGHLGRALDNEVRASDIAGLVTHFAFHSGWPKAVSSLDVIDRVFVSGSSVATAPGEMTVERMLYGLTSWRSPSEIISTPALVAA